MSSKDSKTREHIYPLCINAAHDIAIAKLRGKLEIGKGAAIQLCLNMSLFNLGVLSEEDYKIFDLRYRRKLIDIIEENKFKRENSHLSKLELEKLKQKNIALESEKQKETVLSDLDKMFKGQLEQWDDHDLNWKIRVVSFAKKYPENEYAKQIVAKENDGDIISQTSKEGAI